MSEERYAIIFSSLTGNTRKLADTIQETLPTALCDFFGEAKSAETNAELVYVGFWTDKGTADKACLELLRKLRNKKIFLFGTAGFGGSEAKRTIRRFLPMYMPPSMEVTPSSESTCARVKCRSLYGTAM